MALCLAESLVERGEFDPVDQLQRYAGWYRHGHNASTGVSVGIDDATRRALERFERTGHPTPGDAAPDAAGPAPLARLAPVPMAFAACPDLPAERAALSARATHGAPEAIEATRRLARLLVGALLGIPRDALFGERARAHRGAPAPAPPFARGGDAAGGLEIATWAVATTTSYAGAVLLAADLGDASVAAITGQLAGAVHGADAIPAPWCARVVDGARIGDLAEDLHALARQLVAPS
jgi:ADP-ribosyl-[dinitrogen reductase] hydrolase